MSFDLKVENGKLCIVDGDIVKVEGTDKLRQDVLKAATTPIGGNKLNRWYGSEVASDLIGNILDIDFAKDMAIEKLKNTLYNIQALQRLQAKTQIVTSAERLAAVKSVDIKVNETDKRVLEVAIHALSASMTKVDVVFRVRL